MMIDLKQKDLESLNSSDQHIIVANKYIIDKKIGRGSFGEVFKGYDKDTREPVAIKVVSTIAYV
jgi:serine/threonine protein kinase